MLKYESRANGSNQRSESQCYGKPIGNLGSLAMQMETVEKPDGASNHIGWF
jgi:hypothetical protein